MVSRRAGGGAWASVDTAESAEFLRTFGNCMKTDLGFVPLGQLHPGLLSEAKEAEAPVGSVGLRPRT